jgi:hypothetical protein
MTTFTETTLPVLIGTLPAGQPKGDVPALGRLTINEAQAISQSWLVWGIETNDLYDITATSAALFYEAEGRTLLSSSTVVTLTGASPAGSVSNNAVESAALPTSFVPVLSTQATGAGAHLTHTGQFRVFARVQNTAAAAGSVSLALDWAYGDFLEFTRNATTTLTSDMAATFRIVDLGIVNIPQPLTGAQRWQGRIVASSSAGGDKAKIDCLWLVPVGFGSGEAAAAPPSAASMDLSIADSFNQTAGALAGKVTDIGAATWTFLFGDTDDWNLDTGAHTITRTTTSDTVGTRLITAGTTSFTTVTAQVDMMFSAYATTQQSGVLVRAVDASNSIRAVVNPNAGILQVTVRTAASETVPVFVTAGPALATWYTLKVSIDASGRTLVWWYLAGGASGSPMIDYTIPSAATGGAHASGKVGIADLNQTATAVTRTFDNFVVFAPSAGSGTDAVMFASQSAEVRYDGVVREDSAGAFWQPVGSYEGDLLRVPVAGREGRSVRFIVKASRSDPALGADSAIDDINATLAVTPRYLSVPAPS